MHVIPSRKYLAEVALPHLYYRTLQNVPFYSATTAEQWSRT